MKTGIRVTSLILVLYMLTAAGGAEKKIKKDKLQIVFLMGQSNMVGLADIKTAWYLTQKPYVPPKDLVTQRTEMMDWSSLFWQGINTFKGPQKLKDALNDLYIERRNSRMKWRQRARGDHGPWKEKQWGPKPKPGRGTMYPFLDKKAHEEGIYKRMAEIIASDENRFPPEVAYEEIINRENQIADELKLIRSVYLNGTKAEDFDAFDAAVAEAKIPSRPSSDVDAFRMKYAQLARKHLNIPIAKNTYIYAYGHVTGTGEKNRNMATGPLTVGYGGGIMTIGPEYGVGIALERLVDAPILLVKCSWGNTALRGAWRPPSLDGRETPGEKAQREAWNKQESEAAKKEGREPKLRSAPEKTGEMTYCWGMTVPQIEKVLADPGKFHPKYDPKKGYEVAGMVWFQGYSDAGNTCYGEQLVELIRYMRQKTKTPKMPFVAGTLGMPTYKHMAFEGEVNAGMVRASQHADMAGTVDVVNTCPYYPIELELAGTVKKKAEKDSSVYNEAAKFDRAKSNKGFHYSGSAKFFFLAGDAMGRSLANLMAGGEPTINAVLKQTEK